MKHALTTPEEMRMVKEALLIAVMLEYLDGDIVLANNAAFKLDLVLINSLKLIKTEIIKEYYQLKRALRARGIKILGQQTTQYSIDEQFVDVTGSLSLFGGRRSPRLSKPA